MDNSWISWVNSDTVLGLLRNGLLAAGAVAVKQGLVTSDQNTIVAGAIVSLVSISLSAISNHSKAKAKAVVAAVQDHPNLTIVRAANGAPTISVAN